MPFQMALDEILFRRMETGDGELSNRPLLRFFYSSEPWVSVGYSDHLDLPLSLSRQPVCRRLTGGGRVLHGRDILFSLVAQKGHHDSFGSVRISYLKIHEAVKAAFEALGCRPRFYRCDEKLARGQDCFLFPIATDLGLNGEKIAGGAQKRSGGALLHQESVKPAPGMDAGRLLQAMADGFEKIFEVKWQPMNMDPGLLEESQRLAADKYPPVGPAHQDSSHVGAFASSGP